VIIGGTIIVVTDLVINMSSGGKSDGVESAEEDATTYDSDG
jgi:hypothetical protein